MDIENLDKVLVRYLRKKSSCGKGQPCGVIVAIEKGKVGWSKCHKGDKFDREKGKMIAIRRAFGGLTNENLAKVPHTIRKEFFEMKERSEKYFK